MAVDSAVMVIDSAKGIEPQTKKLFQVCRMRGIPIFTFINKLDRDGREPLDLTAELEDVLGIESYAMNWPIGMGKGLKGLYDIYNHRIELYRSEDEGQAFLELDDNGEIKGDNPLKDESIYKQVLEEIELIEGAGSEFDEEKSLKVN